MSANTKQPIRLDPRDRPRESWRGRLGVLASRGETSGPRVAEAREAMAFWRFADQLDRAVATGLIDRGFAQEAKDVAAGEAAQRMAAAIAEESGSAGGVTTDSTHADAGAGSAGGSAGVAPAVGSRAPS